MATTGFRHVEMGSPHFHEVREKGGEADLPKGHPSIVSIHGDPPPDMPLIAPEFAGCFEAFYKPVFAFAQKMGAELFVLHLGGGAKRPWDQVRDVAAQNCRRLVDFAAPFGVKLALENEWHGGGFPRTPAQFHEMVRLVDRPNFGVTLDIKHSQTSREPDSMPEDFIRSHGKNLLNCHFTELEYPYFSIIELGDWGIPGTGQDRLPRLIASLKDCRYAGPVTAELNQRYVRSVLEIVVKVLKSAGTNVGDMEKILAGHPSLEDRILTYTFSFLRDSIGGRSPVI